MTVEMHRVQCTDCGYERWFDQAESARRAQYLHKGETGHDATVTAEHVEAGESTGVQEL